MNNKAQMSSAFSYILAIVIGGVVFTFLIAFGYQYIGLSGSIGAAELVTSIDDEFAAFSVSESAEKIVDYNRQLEFRILEGSLSSQGQSTPISHIIYSPFELQGKQIYMATKSLELPYRVGNVFYLTDGSTVYVLVYDQSTKEVADDLKNSFNSLPKNFPTEIVSIDQMSANIGEIQQFATQFEKVRFVFFTSYDPVLDDIASNFVNYDVLRVTSSEENYEYGSVEFPDGTVTYLTYPMLVGAIVSFSADGYEYNFNRVLERLSTVTGVYAEKSKFVSARLPECDYTASKTTLDSYRRFIGTSLSAKEYQEKIESVENANKGLGGDCPEVF